MSLPVDELKNRLRQALDLRNMKAIELSEKTGIPKSAISQYMSGYAKPKQDRITLISKALSIDEAWLLGYNVPICVKVGNDTFSNTDINSKTLLAYYNKLNSLGQQKLTDYVEDLKDNPKYCKDTTPSRTVPMLKAAHARTDIEIPEEIDTSDDDIMDDENF